MSIVIRFDTPIALEVAEIRYRSGRKPGGGDQIQIHKIVDGIAHMTVTSKGYRVRTYRAPLKLMIEIPDAQHAADNPNAIGPAVDAQDTTLPDDET